MPGRERTPDVQSTEELSIGAKIRYLRWAAGVSRQQLATAIDRSPNHVSQIELGKANASAEMLAKIAAYFGLTVDELSTQNPFDIVNRWGNNAGRPPSRRIQYFTNPVILEDILSENPSTEEIVSVLSDLISDVGERVRVATPLPLSTKLIIEGKDIRKIMELLYECEYSLKKKLIPSQSEDHTPNPR